MGFSLGIAQVSKSDLKCCTSCRVRQVFFSWELDVLQVATPESLMQKIL
jgi:hypothetical protein